MVFFFFLRLFTLENIINSFIHSYRDFDVIECVTIDVEFDQERRQAGHKLHNRCGYD